MKHYIDTETSEVYAYESDGSQDDFIKEGLIPISDEDLAILRAPTPDELLAQLPLARKAQEKRGVTLKGIRYAGNPSDRQALQEAISFMGAAGLTEFPKWKDSDNEFHADHPLVDVLEAYRAIGLQRVQLIQKESEYVSQILAGTLTDLSNLTWLSS